ncbi:MAG: hypothetical protein SGILL_010776, partial [Bacillariaceae sp.]
MNASSIVGMAIAFCLAAALVTVQAEATAASVTGLAPASPAFVPKTSSNRTGVSSNNHTASSQIPTWKSQLPSPLNNKTKTLQRIVIPGPFGRKVEIYLLGTAHVSNDSSRDVRVLLDSVNPDIIFLELCDQRIPMLIASAPVAKKNETTTAIESKQKTGFWGRLRRKKKQPKQGSKEKKSMYGMAAGLLTSMQQDYADSLGVELGGEFRVAYEYWSVKCDDERSNENARRVHMILGDRPLYLTLTRAWESLRIWGKTKLVVGLLISSLQKPNPDELKEWMQSILNDDDGDLLTKSIAELAKHFPTLEEVIIRERDAYMACKLHQTCDHMLRGSNNPDQTFRLVAIVGAGHIQGICRWLTEPKNNTETPPQILTRLVQLKKPVDPESLDYLINDIMEVNPDLLQDMILEMQQS